MPIDPQVAAKPPVWKVVLNIIYSFLGALKQAGKFQKGQGPDIKP